MIRHSTHAFDVARGRPRVAIIGGGVAGLAAARALHGDVDLTLFEANDRIGGHTNTVPVERAGRTWNVDTGFIVFNRLNYPHFSRILDEIGVASQPSTMSFSVRDDRARLEYNGSSLNQLFSQRRNLLRPVFHRMIRDILRFGREAPAVLESNDLDETVEAYARRLRFGDAFMRFYLEPMGSALWSCPPGRFRTFPIRFVVDFFHHHRMLQVKGRPEWRVVKGGSNAYLAPWTAPFRDAIRTGAPIESVERFAHGVAVTPAGRPTQRFDAVVFACHSDDALRMLIDPTPAEEQILGAIPYQANEAILHDDASVLPRRRRAWGSWNYRTPATDTPGRAAVVATYNMNMLQSLDDAPTTFCVTLNDDRDIDPGRIIRRIPYRHPIFTVDSCRARARRDEILYANRTSYCGAYWGFGFHEDGVRSGLEAADAVRTHVLAPAAVA